MSALPSPDPVSPYILLGMTATTGIVDAVSLLALGHVFTANMTGNVLFLGFALAGAQGFSIPRSSMALIAFLLGAAAGGRLATRMTSRPRHYWTSGAFCIAGFLLIGAVVSLALRSPADQESIPLLGVIGLIALAVGFRNAPTRERRVPDLTTTVLTLTITGVAADSSLAGGTNPRVAQAGCLRAADVWGAAVGGAILKRLVAAALCLCGIASVACALAAFERFPHPRGGDSRSVPPASESSNC
jgi:uncharacterized membrane protein YoaK (UPF0700 family)